MEKRKATGGMTVEEAGRRGGQKVRRLIEEGERAEGEKRGEERER